MGEDTTSVLDRGLTAPSHKLLFDALVGKKNPQSCFKHWVILSGFVTKRV